MPGLDPGIHAEPSVPMFQVTHPDTTWITGTSPAMTMERNLTS